MSERSIVRAKPHCSEPLTTLSLFRPQQKKRKKLKLGQRRKKGNVNQHTVQ